MEHQPPQTPLTSIKLRSQTKKRVAERLLRLHLRGRPASCTLQPLEPPVRIVCIADTHNRQPVLPDGDVLIHAGDLSDTGSFAEVQAGLKWLAAQPHRHKILVAGNHDVLLDDAFLSQHPERRYGQTETRHDLDWGDVTYLEDRQVTVTVGTRSISIYGAPWTPMYGVSAFQYRPDRDTHWSDRLGAFSAAAPPDILVTHGPPKLHCDQRDWYRAGCAYLAEQVARVRPRLCVFGHIHAGYGREDVEVDAVQWQHDAVVMGWAGWPALAWMGALVLWYQIRTFLCVKVLRVRRRAKITAFVNAAVVGGPDNELRNAPTVVEI